jgi:hypothetical protein
MADPEEADDAHYPCPACGARLFGWAAARHPVDGSKIVLDHCENDGLIVTRAAEPPDPARELDDLLATGGQIEAPNRESFQGGIGGAQWAGLEPERRRLHLNPRAAKLLLRKRGVEVLDSSTPFSGRSYATMLQTMINAFTLKDNFFRNARAGRLQRQTPRERLAFALDAIVSVLVAIPLSIVALPAELLGCLVGRGGRMVLTTAVDPSTPAAPARES